jgi:hypothetical protein
MISVGSFCTYGAEELALPSAVPKDEVCGPRLDCDADIGRLGFRCEESEAVGAASARYLENMASAASIVGSSRLAGVPVFDRDRRVDFPKAPLSGTCFLVLIDPVCPSELLLSANKSCIIFQEADPGKTIAYGLCMPSSPMYNSSSGTL